MHRRPHKIAAKPGNPEEHPPGLLLHSPALYDLMVWLAMLGRTSRFRNHLVRLAALAAGETVLDVGCGTGRLAMAAKRAVGPEGRVQGIDASPEMLVYAKKRAKWAGLDIEYRYGTAQALPVPDGQCDAVLVCVMLHHLSRPARRSCLHDIARILVPGGRALIVDFTAPARRRKGPFAHGPRHGYVRFDEIAIWLGEAGLTERHRGNVGFGSLDYLLAEKPGRR